jgi:hypothetical protein
MDGEHLCAEWGALGADMARELAQWRATHPKATLAEIEAAVLEAMSRLQARVLSDLAHASGAADLTQTPSAERPGCPTCGGALEPRGTREREVLTPRQTVALTLRRSYGACSACGTGLFPPG